MRAGSAVVYTGPGATALTRTPRGLNSATQDRVMASSVAFVPPYAAAPGMPIPATMLATLTMLPPPAAAIRGASAATRKYAARTVLSNTASWVASSRSTVGPNQEIPALLTSTSTVARPMPEVAPVTRAVWPRKLC
jgi:hypothetical protein